MKKRIVDIDKIETLIAQGYVMKNKHPEANLWIYNYTQNTQYEQYWTSETLQCRGLIMDNKGIIKSRPLSKFFNIEEIGIDKLPELPFQVSEKMDGSLGIMYWIDDQAYIASRGSFNSEQAIFANKLLQEKYKNAIKNLDSCKTYVFEIIYPENRIVVDYKDEELLILLAIIDTETGREEELINLGFPLPKRYPKFSKISDLKELNWNNHEGFVIRFSNSFRVKIKFEDYMKTHKVVTQLSSIIIWEYLKEKKPLIPFLEKVPDEFYDWVRKTEASLNKKFKIIETKAQSEYKELATVKETALYFKTCEYTSILFAMYTNKRYDQIIWKMIRPKFEKAFSNKN